jgi:hypothetical protein
MAYISREKAIEIVKSGGYWEREDMEVAVACIEQTPTADFVEVVRCKDCGMKGAAFCMAGDFPLTEKTKNNFCSYGERRTDNGL